MDGSIMAADSSPSAIDQMDEHGGEEKEQEQEQEQEQEEEEEEELHVLAVDDCLIDRKLVETLLKKSSCKVTTAENGQMALEFLGLGSRDEHHASALTTTGVKVNLVITDYSMPGMTGYELLKKIKESSTMKEIPVVIVSSDNSPTRVNKCLEEGAQEFILKPLQQSDVKNLRCQMMKISKSCSGRLYLPINKEF